MEKEQNGSHKGLPYGKESIKKGDHVHLPRVTTLLNQQATSENLVVYAVIEEFLCLIEEVVLSNKSPKGEILTGQGREAVADSVGD